MWWPIRNQILVPFVLIVIVAVATIASAAAMLAARRSEQQTLAHLRNVIETLGQTPLPYTAPVLQKMRGLSGAEFVAYSPAGKVVAGTLPEAEQISPAAVSERLREKLDALDANPTIMLDGTRYFVAALKPPANPAVSTLLVLYPESSWSRARWDAAVPPLAVGVAAVVLTSVVSTWLSQRFSRRLRRLQAQAASIAAGNFQQITSTGRHDEFQDLVVSVNSMCGQLQKMQQTIRQSERTQLLAQLAGGLAHQLRNAVTGARLALQIHQRRCSTSAEDQSVAVALRQLSLTEAQLRGMLSLGRLECREHRPCHLSELLAEVALLVGPACDHSRVKMNVSTENLPPSVLADVDGLRAAVLNLTLNAIDAAGPGGDVALSAHVADSMIVIDVHDSGAGPPTELATTLFDPFVSSKPEGVGLGLSLAWQVAHDHDGSLTWDRDAGRTHFRLQFPGKNMTKPSSMPALQTVAPVSVH